MRRRNPKSTSSRSSSSPSSSSASPRSNLATFPGTSPPTGSLHPSSYRPDFDIVFEIEHNRERYSGSSEGESQSWISIYQFPGTFRTSLDRIRAACEGPSKPGINPTIACCIAYGLDLLQSNSSVSSLLGLRSELFRLEVPASAGFAAEFEELVSFMRSFYFTIPDPGSPSKINVSLPEHLKLSLSAMADELGTSLSSAATLCIGLSLRDQPEVMPTRRKELEASLDALFDRIELRFRVAKVWLATLREQRMKEAQR